MSVTMRDGHYAPPDMPVRVCSHPDCSTLVRGGFSCMLHRHHTDAELRIIEKTYVRPDWDVYFTGIAQAVAARADCRRTRFGAVIVDTRHRVVATGYNGSPPGGKSCLAGECPRALKSADEVPHGSPDYSDCIALHAETNAIANADAERCDGATIYIVNADGPAYPPCDMCAKLCAAAGIARVVW